MAQNVTIAGASYEDVSGIEVPKTGNNAGTALFNDVSDTTAVADDVVQGKYFYNASGVKTAGTRSATSLDPDVSNENLLLDSTVTPVIDTPDRVKTFNIPTYTTFSNYKLTATGLRYYDTTAKIVMYKVIPGQILYLKILADTPGVYQFHKNTGNSVPTSGTNSYLVGSVVTTAVDDFITVPSSAYYLVVSYLKANESTVEVKSSMLDAETVDSISRITLPNADAYDVKDRIARQGVVYGYVNSDTSIANRYDVVATGLTELKSGTVMYLYNNYVASTGNQVNLNVNNLGTKPVYLMHMIDTRATVGNTFRNNNSHLLIYDEYYAGGAWLLVNITVNNSVASDYSIPTGSAVASYVNNVVNSKIADIPVRGSYYTIYITPDQDTSYIETYSDAIYIWPVFDDLSYQAWFKIQQVWPDEGDPSIVVPTTLLLRQVVADQEDSNSDYILYSQMYNNGYYEFQFIFNETYNAYDVKWYFRPITVSGTEMTTNKVTSLSSSSTDTQYPSAKCVYDIIGDVELALAALR